MGDRAPCYMFWIFVFFAECDKEPLNGQCEMGYILNQEINCCGTLQ